MSNLNAQINVKQLNTDSKVTSQSIALPSPNALKQKYALSQIAQQQILQHRQEIKNILNGDDSRLLVIVGRVRFMNRKQSLNMLSVLKFLLSSIKIP